jgi:hypothetical protein
VTSLAFSPRGQYPHSKPATTTVAAATTIAPHRCGDAGSTRELEVADLATAAAGICHDSRRAEI